MKGQIMYVCTYIHMYMYICNTYMLIYIYKIDIFKTRKFPTSEKAHIKPQY